MKNFRKMITIIVAVAISLSFTANAQVTYNSNNSGDWNNSGTWDPNGIPTISDNVIINSGHTVTIQTATEAKANNVTVNGILDVFGTLRLLCGDALVDSRDGQSYATVQIGGQCWMAENLNIGTRINGSVDQTNNSTIEKYCYGDDPANCDTYGGLYQWDEMMQYVTTPATQGICPTGWHIPTDDEFKTMEMHLGMSASEADNTGWRGNNEGSKLASNASLWDDGNLESNPDFGISGFDFLPGGLREQPSGSFGSKGGGGFMWLSSESGTNAWRRYINHTLPQIFRSDYNKTYGLSVRCIRD